MRWTYAQTPQELKAKQAKLDAIETFWNEFVGNMANIESYFSDTTSFDLPGFMQEQLAVVDERLVFEFGPAVHTKGRRLVITCELTETLSPMLDDMMAAAPKLGGWEFYTRRIAGPYDDVLFYIEGRSGVDVSQWRVRTSVEGRRIRLDFLAPDHRPEAEEHLWNACCVATEALLGDETMGAWIGGITVDKLKTGRRFVPPLRRRRARRV